MDSRTCSGEIVADLGDKTIRAKMFSVLSALVTLTAIAFVIEKLWRLRLQLIGKIDIAQLAVIILVGSILFAIDGLLLILAWRHLVVWLGTAPLIWQAALTIYGRTQVTKYLPGNVLQFPSRHILGRQFDLDHKALLGAAVFEIIGLFIASTIVSSVKLFVLKEDAAFLSSAWLLLILVLGIILPFFLHTAFSRFSFLQNFNALPKTIQETYKGLLPTWFMYLLFFVVAGSVLSGIAYGMEHSSLNNLLPVTFSAYAVSWLAGTITPGAPGGAGVREAVLIMMLSPLVGESSSILIALTTRVATILGDVYIYALASLVSRF
jgi:uncharacterized membrane protein YbhN (UPF0104 family)